MKTHLLIYATLTAAWLVLSGAGCSSLSQPNTASFASVTIQNHSVEDIISATTKAFGEDGYTGGMKGSGNLVFERQASRGTTLSREGLYATQQGARTVNRVKVEIVPLAGGSSYRLQCKAYVVRDAGSLVEDEVPYTNLRSGPYQALLNKVQKELK